MKRLICVLFALIMAMSACVTVYAADTVKIDMDTTYQTIDGFGAAYTWYSERLLNHNNKEALLDEIFINCNFNIMRFIHLQENKTRPTTMESYKEYYDAAVERGIDPLIYNYLLSIYGEYTLAGQHSTEGMNSAEFDSIKEKTGKVPALIEIDIMKISTPFSSDYNNIDLYFDRIKAFDKKGGIVVLNWHWHAPPPYIYNDSERPWWRGFYAEATSIDIEKIMNGEDPEGLELLNEDIDVVAKLFKKLQDKNIPVLFRPLHEAGGGWFWWGAKGAEPFKALYIHLYDRLTNYHGLNNIIWVWNGDDAEWYPGDEYVDIASTDIYADSGEYSSQINDFIAVGKSSNGTKPVALSENGVQIDPDMMTRDNVYWLYFCTWGGDYCTSDKYTSDEMFSKVFNSEKVITLDELPNWRRY